MQNKSEPLKQIIECANLYRENFSEYDFLLIYDDSGRIEMLEISFKASNFTHLTGVTAKEDISAYEFFNKAVGKRLSESDFEMEEKRMAKFKLSVLPNFLSNPARSFNMIGEYNTYSKKELKTEHLAGGEKSCMGFTRNEKDIFVPNTILQEDIRNNIKKVKHVLAVWRKKRGEKFYTEELSVNEGKLKKTKLTQQYASLKDDKFRK